MVLLELHIKGEGRQELLAGPAAFGRKISPSTGVGRGNQVVLATPVSACGHISNSHELANNIALVRRGSCSFIDKVRNAQAAGAVAVLVMASQPAADKTSRLFTMTGDGVDDVTIPAAYLDFADAMPLMDHVRNGRTVHATMRGQYSGDVGIGGLDLYLDYCSL